MFLMPWRRQAAQTGLSRRVGDPLDDFRREMDTLIEQFFTGSMLPVGQESGQRFWGLDVTEEGNDLVVRAEVPGFENNDLDIQLDNDVLTIKAEKKQEGEEKRERSFRSYVRTITLPPGLDTDKAQATCHTGILELRFPRSQRPAGKRIAVQARPAGTTEAAASTQQAEPAQPAGKS